MFPGDVVRVNYPGQKVNNLIARVITIDRGTSGAEEIVIEWSQDVFGVAYSDFDDVATAFNGGGNSPLVVKMYLIWTAPYYAIAGALGDTQAQALAFPVAYAVPLAVAPTSDTRTIDYYVSHVSTVGQTVLALGGTIPPTRFTHPSAALAQEPQSSISVVDPSQMGVVGDFVLIENGAYEELTVIGAVGSVSSTDTTPVYTLWRGVLDTLPRAWPQTANMWLIPQANSPVDSSQHMVGETAEYQFLPYTSLGRLDISQAPVQSGVLTDRAYRPLPNVGVVVNNGNSSFTVLPNKSIAVAWNRRNRITQTSQILKYTDTDVVPEANQTTTISIIDSTGAVVQSYTGLTGTSYSIADFSSLPTGSAVYTVTVGSVRDGFMSFTTYVSQPITVTK